MQNQPMKEQIEKASEMTPAAAKKVVKIKSESEESYFSKIDARLSAIESESANLKAANIKLSEENEALKKQLAETPANHTKFNPESKAQSEIKFKIGSRREESILDRVMSSIS
jgi:predicted RNase H-like nuclease (RuvC/YqgF family)